MKGRPDSLREAPGSLPNIYIINLSSRFSSRDLSPFMTVIVCWGSGNYQIFWGLLDISYKLTLIPRDSKYHCGPPVRIESYSGQMISA